MNEQASYDALVASDTLWSRLAYTPLSDALRGRLTGRLDLRRALATANLPGPLAALVCDVARRTRLWRIERVDVAQELAAHFRDGLDSGASPEQLIKSFGDPRQAARLIRRAKLRARPWPWQACRWGLRAAAAVISVAILAYLGLAVRFWIGRPQVTRDYVAEINAAAQEFPAEERAWPLYRQALMALDLPPADKQWWTDTHLLPAPGDAAWQDLAAFVEKNQPALALTRQGAARSALGFVYGDPADREFLLKTMQRESVMPAKDDLLISLLLPHQQEPRQLAWLLVADARQAQLAGDGPRLAADVRSLLGMANQQRTGATLLEDIISLATFGLALDMSADALADGPELLPDADLVALAHVLAAYGGGGTLRPRVDREQRLFDDLLQRSYTDDGQGDGYLTAEGFRFLSQFDGMSTRGSDGSWVHSAVGPGMSVALAGRREMRELALRLNNQIAAEHAGPLYTWQPSAAEAELRSISSSISTRLRYFPVLLLLPAQQAVAMAGERATQRRDAVLTAIALELHRRRTGGWPQQIEELVPALLPEVPLDRFTGGPLAYRLVDGQPLLYARGMDGQDDGGRPPPDEPSEAAGWQSIMVKPASPLLPGQGFDWVLWPRPRGVRPAAE